MRVEKQLTMFFRLLFVDLDKLETYSDCQVDSL